MEAIAINRRKQKKLNVRVKRIKESLKNGLKLNENSKDTPVKRDKFSKRGVVYIGHLPHGFYEDQIRDYCSQFGIVTRLRVARSPKTGKSKGFAFVEFLEDEVAKVVAEAMNNYLMFDRLLICQYVPVEKRHKNMFFSSITSTSYPALKRREIDTKRKNAVMSKKKERETRAKNLRKIEDFKRFFEERGIEFNFKVNDPLCGDVKIEKEEPAVLEIDESDDEIEFNTPPHVQKVFKRKTPVKKASNKRSKVKGMSRSMGH